MAALHASAFAGQGRGWSAREFATLQESPHVFVCGTVKGFALGRCAADEAELLTLATDPDQRRKGIAKAALAAFEAEAARRGATRAFLEVAEDNQAARALYMGTGYCEIARREAYYERPGALSVAAILLEKALT
jgi:ribosomal-protein-alanine N-acetyltransferase